LFHQQTHGEVEAQLADLVAAQVDDRVRHPDRLAGGLNVGELPGMLPANSASIAGLSSSTSRFSV
jgi:hypothetical protein